MSEETVDIVRAKSSLNLKEFLFKYLPYLPWLGVSIAICLLCGFIYLRYSSYIYRATGRMLVKKQVSTTSRDRFDDIFMSQGAANLNDEIEQMKSASVGLRVVKSLGLQISYYNKGKIRDSRMHRNESPVLLNVVSLPDSMTGYSLEITVSDDNKSFVLSNDNKKYFFNQRISLKNAVFIVEKTYVPIESFASKVFVLSYQPAEQLAKSIGRSAGIVPANDFSSVLNVSFDNENPRLAMDLVNGFMDACQEASLEEKRQIAGNTLNFINDQLNTLRTDLGSIERNLQNFREKNRAVDVEAQSVLSLNKANTIESQSTQLEVKIKVLDYLLEYMANDNNSFKLVPATLGIQEPALLQSVSEYNKLQLQRETSLQTIPPSNPVIVNMETTIQKLKGDIIENLKNVRQSYVLEQNNLNLQTQRTESNITTIPGKQKQLLEISRQQKILEELYSYLLQKKLETSIGSASTVSNIRVIEAADYNSAPVAPNRKAIYLLALVAGIAIPTIIIFIAEMLNDKVRSKSDIEKITQTPVLGEIGHSENKTALVVTKNNRQYLAEQFRIVRSNLQYILPKVDKPVLLVTSSFSGEGKSFISTNIGSVMALSGKRTVILEFDIRKPKILHGLGLSERRGITNYIVGNVGIRDVIYPVPDVENLWVMPCGPVPPNPAEMLLSEHVDKLFDELRSQFDVIIIDTAPIGLVSDAVVLGRHADASLYIVRHNYTHKKQIELIDDLYQNNKLPHLSIIINDINSRGGYGGYYGYGNYGYGYGYGYDVNRSNGYFDNGRFPRLNVWRKWFQGEKKTKKEKSK